MSLKKIKNNVKIDGVEYDIWYNPETGSVQARTDVGVFNKQGDLVFDSLNDQNSVFEDAIKKDIEVVKRIKKAKNKAGDKGSLPGIITDKDIQRAEDDAIGRRVTDEFKTTDQDYYFGAKKAAQYPVDAIYNKSGESQDHLVISQYRYKPPRAETIWGQKEPGKILTEGLARKSPLDEFLGLVRLPMPNALQDSNNVNWGSDEMNALEAAALNMVQPNVLDLSKNAFGAGVGGLAAGLAEGDIGDGVKGGIAGQLLGKMAFEAGSDIGKTILPTEAVAMVLGAAGIETSAEAILARKEGIVPNSNLELLFSGPTLRQFGFVYKLSPRSESEATIVNQILRFFKQGMAARKQSAASGGLNGGRSYFLGTPNVFRLQYRTSDNEAIKGINRIKTCALTGTSVNYTPEGAFASYEKGQPVSILLSLNFQELEPIYDTDYKFEKGDGERGDSDSGEGYRWKIREDEVGY
tara:strand:+ start:41 stop:1435 length:1395 start_codon:yes stop_codon:yes gene_type:complete